MSDYDERVLSMRFENDGFEEKVDDTIGALSRLNQSLAHIGGDGASNAFGTLQSSINNLSFDSISQAIDTINYRFSDFGIASARIIENLADQVFDLGEKIVSSLTIDPIKLGWSEYNQLIDISKIIQANTDASIGEINDITDALNTYADKTIYNYGNMSNIMRDIIQQVGSLTTTINATGEEISTEKLVEGLANYMGLTGQGNAQLSRVGIQVARVLGGSPMTKQTINSLIRNGAGGKMFQELWTQASKNLGLADKLAASIDTAGSFLESFSRQAAKGDYMGGYHSQIMTEVLRILQDQNDPIGRKAIEAVKTPTTFQQVLEQSTEAVQTGWTRIWRTIVGDLEEAKDIWRVVNQHLNETNGVLTQYSEYFGSLFEEWKDLGGRTQLINALFDAFQGLYNIVVSVKEVISDFFPGIGAADLLGFSSSFEDGAANFKEWTEDLRAFFGNFTKGYEFWSKHNVNEIPVEPIEHFDHEYYDSLVDDFIASHSAEIDNWLSQFHGPEYYKTNKDGTIEWDQKAVQDAIKNFDWTYFANGDKVQKSIEQTSATIVAMLAGIDGTDYWRKRHFDGVMSDDFYNYAQEEEDYRNAYLRILKELGYDVGSVQQQLHDEAIYYEEQPSKQDEYDTHYATPLLRQGWSDAEYLYDIYHDQNNVIKFLYGINSALSSVIDSVKTIHYYLIKPLVGDIITHALSTLSDIIGNIGANLSNLMGYLGRKNYLKTLALGIYRFIAQNTNFTSFFEDITYVVTNLSNSVFKLIYGFDSLANKVSNSGPVNKVRSILTYLWHDVLGPLISNDNKTGATIGGIIGALLGALKGFFTGGPLGMIIGGVKGLAKGFLKGNFFGTITNVLKFLIKNKRLIKELFDTIGSRISTVFESIGKGFTSKKNPLVLLVSSLGKAANTIRGIVTGEINPIQNLIDFFKSESVTNFFDKLKEPFEKFGAWLSDFWDGIYTNVTTFFQNMSTKWKTYMESADNNPFKAIGQMIKDSNIYKIISDFFGMIGDTFKSFWEGLFGSSEIEKSAESITENKLFKNLPLISKLNLQFFNFRQTLDDFKNGETFGKIKDFFKGLGEGISEVWKVVSSGDVFNIIANGFKAIGGVFGSFFKGIIGIPNAVAESVEKIDKTSFSDKISEISKSLTSFVQGETFQKVTEFFYNFGTKLAGTAVNVLDFLTAISDPFIKTGEVKESLSTLKNIIGDFFVNFAEGFSGKEYEEIGTTLSDSIKGIFSDISTGLKEFKKSDFYDVFKEFAEFLGGKFRDTIEWFIETISSIPDKLSKLKNPIDTVKGFFKDIKESANSISEPLENLGGAILSPTSENGEKSKGFLDGVINKVGGVFDFLMGVQTVHADTMDAVEGTTELSNAINQNADEVNTASENVKTYADLFASLSTSAKFIAGVAVLIGGLALGRLFVSSFGILRGIFGVAHLIGDVSGAIRADTFLKYTEALGIIIASIGGLALVIDSLKDDKSFITATLMVSGMLIAILVLMNLFSTSTDAVNLPKEGFSLLQTAVDGLSDAIKDIAEKIGIWMLIGGIVAAMVVISAAIYKLASIGDLDALKTAGIIVGAIAFGLAALTAGVWLLVKVTNKMDTLDMSLIAATIVGIAGGVAAITYALVTLFDLFQKNLAKKEDANIWSSLGLTLLTVIGTVVVLVAGALVLAKLMPKNPVFISAMVSGAISIMALGVGIRLVVDSILSIMDAVSNNKEITPDMIVMISAAIGILIVAMGLFAALASTTGKPVALRTSIALFAVALAVKLMVGTLKDLIDYVTDEDSKIDPSSKNFVIPAVAIAIMTVVLGGAAWMMEHGAVALRTSMALFAIVAAVGIILLEIKELINIFNSIEEKKGGPSRTEQFERMVGTMIKLLATLALAVVALKTTSVKFGAFSYTANTGLLSAIAAIGLMYAVMLAIQSLESLKGVDWEKDKNAIWGLVGIIGVITAAVKIIGGIASVDNSGKKSRNNTSIQVMFLSMILVLELLAGAVLAMTRLAALDLAGDDYLKIAGAISIVMLIAGLMSALLVHLSKVDKENVAGLAGWAEFGKAIASVVVVLGGAALSLGLLSQYVQDPEGLVKIAEALAIVMVSLAGVAWIAAQIGTIGAAASAGLKTIGIISAVISAVIGVVATTYGALHTIGKGIFKTDEVILFDQLGEGLTVFAGFLGKLVSEFKKNAMVSDSKAIVDQTKAVSEGMSALSTSVENIDFPKLDKVQETLKKFEELGRTLNGIIDTGSGIGNASPYTMFGQDLNGFSEQFEKFGQAVVNIDGTIDLDLVQSIADAFAILAGIEMPTTDGFLFKKEVDFTNIGANIGGIGDAINALYTMCQQITDSTIISNVTTLLDNLWEFFEKAKDYKTIETVITDFLSVIESIANFGVTKKGATDTVALDTLDKFVLLLTSISDIANLTIDNPEMLSGFVTSLAQAFGGVYEDIRGIGTSIAQIVMGGFKSYVDEEGFIESAGYIVEGLVLAFSSKYEDIRDAGKGLAKILKNSFRKELGIASPSKEFYSFGEYVVMGLCGGIDENLDPVAYAAKKLADTLTDNFDPLLEMPKLDPKDMAFYSNPLNVNPTTLMRAATVATKKAINYSDSDILNMLVEGYGFLEDDLFSALGSDMLDGLGISEDSFLGKRVSEAFDGLDTKWSEAMTATEDKITEKVDEIATSIYDILGLKIEVENEKESQNGHTPTNFVEQTADKVMSGIKDLGETLITNNDYLSAISDFVESGAADTTDIFSFLQDKGISFSKTKLQKVLESDWLQKVLGDMGLGELAEDPGYLIDLFKSSGGDVGQFVEGLKKSFPNLDISIGDATNLLSVLKDTMNFSGLSSFENSSLMDYLGELIPGTGTNFGNLGDMGINIGSDVGEAIGDAFGISTKGVTDSMQETVGEQMEQVDQRITDMALRVIRGEFGNNPDRQRLLESMGYSFGVIQNEVNRLLGCNFRYAVSNEDVQRTLEALGGTAQTTTTQLRDAAEDVVVLSESGKNIVEVLDDENNALDVTKEKTDKYLDSIKSLSNAKDYMDSVRIASKYVKSGDLKLGLDELTESYSAIRKEAQEKGIRLLPDSFEKDAQAAQELNDIIREFEDNYERGKARKDGFTTSTARGLVKKALNNYLMHHSDNADVVENIQIALRENEKKAYYHTVRFMKKASDILNEKVNDARITVDQELEAAQHYLELGDSSKAVEHLNAAISEMNQVLEQHSDSLKEANASAYAYNATTETMLANADRYSEKDIPKMVNDMNSSVINSMKKSGNFPGETYSQLAFDTLKQMLEKMGLEYTEEFNNLGNVIGMTIFGKDGKVVDDVTFKGGVLRTKMESVFKDCGTVALNAFVNGLGGMTGPMETLTDDVMTNAMYMANVASKASGVAADENFQYTPSAMPVISAGNISEFRDMLNTNAPYDVNIATSSGYDKLLRLSEMFEQKQYRDQAMNEYLEGIYKEMPGIKKSVTTTNDSIEDLRTDLNNLRDSMSQMKVVLNDDTLVGKIAPGLNRELGKIQNRRERSI